MASASSCMATARAAVALAGVRSNGKGAGRTRAATARSSKSRLVSSSRAAVSTEAVASFADFLPTETAELEEPAAVEMARMCRQIPTEVPGRAKEVLTSCVGAPAPKGGEDLPPFVLLHGFDSSCLEYRRLFPRLSQKAETWALDLLGWGFTDAQDGGIGDYSPEAKCAHLYAFWKENIGRPMVLCGASLGGAAAIDFAVAHPEAVAKVVLVDAQGFIEGIGPMASLPRPIAKVGVNVLRTVPLRAAANKMAYFDKERYATDDALRVGRLHTFLPQWSDATLSFMQSGGFKVVNKIPTIPQDVLVMWGRQDNILEPSNAERFESEVPNARLLWVEECGHVPHLEQPEFMCDALVEFAAGSAK